MREDEAGWLRAIFSRALPGHTLAAAEPLAGGFSNTLYRLRVEDLVDIFVLRVHTRDPGACRKEIELHQLVGGTVPVPEIVYADPDGAPPHVVMRWVEGTTFRDVKHSRDADAVAGCAWAIGETLAGIGTFRFPRPGAIGPGLEIGAPFPSAAEFVEECLRSPVLQGRLEADKRNRVGEYILRWMPRLRDFDRERTLVHCDFGSPNLIMRYAGGQWRVAAVLDWEFAFSGPAICDTGHMMRYERRESPRLEPHFSRAYCEAGGALSEDWFELGRAMDLTALLEFLTRPGLPASVAPEIVGLVEETVRE